ncbi:MAG: gamma-glutamyltransferase [Xanthobacteraceae bacterium]
MRNSCRCVPGRFVRFLALIAVLLLSGAAFGQDQAGNGQQRLQHAQEAVAHDGMVVAQEPQAARIGVAILKQGGNAIDAAVAVGFALAATYPRAGNIGGGGFMVIHRANGQDVAIDYRETAPRAITDKSFLDARGNADPQKSRNSALAIGVPGTVAGLALAEEKFGSGRFTLADLMAPAIALARDGFTVTLHTLSPAPSDPSRLKRWPSSAKLFFNPDGSILQPGERLVQPDLAKSLEAIAKGGPRAFYQGPIAAKIAAAIRTAGGVMTVDDLKNYRAIERRPVRGTYRGYDIVSMPPPSSGGIELIEMLNILEGYDLTHADQTQELFLLIEAMKRAYADRALYLGDPDQVENPVARLISKDYAATWRATIDSTRATPANAIGAGGVVQPEGRNTTHFSVVDRFGNAVSNTYTLNFIYGLGMVAEGTGILLNNELDDFAAKPDSPNAFGLTGFKANAPGPGKRPLSSMTPTIVLKDGKPFLVTGSPGGSHITTAVLQVIVNVIDRGMNIADAVSAPRVHDQWLPDRVSVEPGLPDDVLHALQARGDKIRPQRPFTSANSITVEPGEFTGAADPREGGALAVGY